MDTLPFFAVLASAFLHAAWNALARSAPEPGEALACGVAASGLAGAFGLMFTGLPEPASWPWLAGGVAITAIGLRLAMAAYRSASFGLAYPVMRAGIPLLTLAIGAALLGEWPKTSGVVGVLLIAAALILLALAARRAGRSELEGLGFALLAAVAGAGYVLADAIGVRLSGDILAYAFLVSVGNAAALTLLSAFEGRHVLRALPREAPRAALIAGLSTASFTLYLWALATSPMALTAALRETSVLFAVAMARYALNEDIGRWQWGAALLALAGVVAIKLA